MQQPTYVRRRIQDMTTPIKVLPRAARRLGSHRIVAPIARGGISDVFLAEHIHTGERVALKVLDPVHLHDEDIVARLLYEHRLAGRVSHPGLIEVKHADRNEGDLPYIVMEYLDGENLGDLAERGLIDMGAVLAIGQQIASAVAALHAAGIVHCDIKPDNVFVLYEPGPGGWPKIKVIDYGVAHDTATPPNDDGTIAGTPPYMPPEQWRGHSTEKSDVYALGCLLFELCTGDVPFHGTLPQLLVLHTEALPPRPSSRRSDLAPVLDHLIMRCLAKDPGMRPTMADIEIELSRLGRDLEPAMMVAVG